MSDFVDFATGLKDKHSKARAKVERAQSTLAAAIREFEELDVAVKVLVKHGYMNPPDGGEIDAAPKEAGSTALNETQALVLEFVPHGEVFAVAPKDVVSMVHARGRDDITADYVRTTLWRLAKRDILENENGLYWRPAAKIAQNVEAPGARAAEASNVLGPLGGERGYPPSAPEGSIPSGSTPSIADLMDTEIDDDVPF